MWGGDMMGWGGGWGWFGMVHVVLWWVLIVLGIVLAAKWLFGSDGPDAKGDRALVILRERYARGDIDKAEFDARRRDLGG